MFNFRLALASHLLLFFHLFDDDGPPEGGPSKEYASVREFDEFPLKTTLLLSSNFIMTKFSMGTDLLICQRGKM